LFDAAKFHGGLPPGLSRRHASAQIVFDVKPKMALHLGRQLSLAKLFVK
jgi:hypothetical protein